MPRKIFVTTALPYANGAFHLGHIMEYIQADIWVRALRMGGNEVHFVGADDAHGAPIMIAAQKIGISPDQFVGEVQASRAQYLKGFDLSFDHWHSTHSVENTEWSHKIYRILRDQAKLITTRQVEQFFDPERNMFLPDRFIKGTCPKCDAADQYGDSCEVCSAVYAPTELKNPYSVLSGATPLLKSSEHFFFKLSDDQCVSFLRQWSQDGKLQPEVANKVKEWLNDDESGQTALTDWDISRDAPYFGIEIPDAPGKYFYVWLDAPIGYLASLDSYFKSKNQDCTEFLADPNSEQYHFIGKDIIYFHTLFWPAMLQFSSQKLPNNIFVHGFITVSGAKMSKSRGTGISPLRYLELGLNSEWLRYYLASKLSERVEDIDFGIDDFAARINSDLVGKYVNLASRSSGFLLQHFAGQVGLINDTVIAPLRAVVRDFPSWYEKREYGRVLREIMRQADLINQYVDQEKPWVLAKSESVTDKARLHEVCSTILEAFRLLSLSLKPVLPQTIEKVQAWLGGDDAAWLWVGVDMPLNGRIAPYQHLMTRVDVKTLEGLLN